MREPSILRKSLHEIWTIVTNYHYKGIFQIIWEFVSDIVFIGAVDLLMQLVNLTARFTIAEMYGMIFILLTAAILSGISAFVAGIMLVDHYHYGY